MTTRWSAAGITDWEMLGNGPGPDPRVTPGAAAHASALVISWEMTAKQGA
jgi:hypothetical protein